MTYILIGIYCGAAWGFMALTFYLIPSRKELSDYLLVIFAPISLIGITGYELWQLRKKKVKQ